MNRVEDRRMEHGVVRWIVTEKGQRYTHYDCERRAKAAVNAFERWFHRTVRTRTAWDDAEMNDSQMRDLRYLLKDVQGYVELASLELDRLEGVDRRAERIKALRAVAGRTPAEAAAYLAKADQLEGACT